MNVKNTKDLEFQDGIGGERVQILFESDYMTLTRVIMGGGVLLHKHQKRGEIYYILWGSGKMKLGEEEREIVRGDVVHVKREEYHSMKRTSVAPLDFLVCSNGKYEIDDIVYHN